MALRQQCRCEGFYMFRQPTAVLLFAAVADTTAN